MKVSVIIPTYNEENVIGECLSSLMKQNYKNLELIVVDDGSADNTIKTIEHYPVKLFKQKHLGAGSARNLGAKHSIGQILVFVDADMTFDKEFIECLVKPIIEKKTIGTFSKDEYVSNKNNTWSKCWNINKGLPIDKMHPLDYPDTQPVFRAILKKEFERVGGFDLIGYIDDHTLSVKLGKKANVAVGAIFYHKNPDNLREIFNQARWIGKSEFKNRKIKNEFIMKFISIIRYSFPFTLIFGVIKSIQYGLLQFLIFKIVYDTAVEISLINSFIGEHKYK